MRISTTERRRSFRFLLRPVTACTHIITGTDSVNFPRLCVPMIVTIDGPAGAGKSSAARMLAQRLGFDFLDTGAMYRAVTLAGLRSCCNLSDQPALAQLLDTMHLEMPPGRILLN